MTWILLAGLLQIEEKKIDRQPSLLPVQAGQTLWASKLQVDVSKLWAATAGLLTEKPEGPHIELTDNLGDGLLATARDASGRTVATAVLKHDGLAEFSHLRALVRLDAGTLVVRDRFLAPKGEAEPWGVFQIDASSGEEGQEVPEAEVKGRKIRRTYALYFRGPNQFVWADYDGDGRLTRAGRAEGAAVQLDHTRERQKGGTHGLWVAMKMPLQTDGAKLPDAQDAKEGLTEAALVTRYEGGVYWRVKVYDKDGHETKTTFLKFNTLPFDASFDKLVAADKQKWK